MLSELEMLAIVGLSISLILSIHLWTWRKGQTREKVFWTVLLCFLYVGPVFYLALYDPPPKKHLKQQIKDADYRF